tara:strand:+ start:356 stop:616 length:261 start_codon:yes stop_codon:yes gene_type:complete
MTKYISFVIIFILGCQHNWSISEQEDFKKRCVNHHLKVQSLDEHKSFCNCILKNSMNLNLPYSQFLKMESNNSETEDLLKSCIEIP